MKIGVASPESVPIHLKINVRCMCIASCLSFKDRPHLERSFSSRGANRKPQKLFPFQRLCKLVEKHRWVPIQLNTKEIDLCK